MGVRAKLPRSSELMALCNHTPEAAILYYKEENYEEAVEQAVRALESDPLCSEIDALYTVIDDGCLRLNNANCLDRLDKTVVNGSGRYRDTLFRHLAAQIPVPQRLARCDKIGLDCIVVTPHDFFKSFAL